MIRKELKQKLQNALFDKAYFFSPTNDPIKKFVHALKVATDKRVLKIMANSSDKKILMLMKNYKITTFKSRFVRS